jgi:alcohol dehydrogenase (cytochrome c)
MTAQAPATGGRGGRGADTGLMYVPANEAYAGDQGGNLVAYDPANGKILWHSRIGAVSNAPDAFTLY